MPSREPEARAQLTPHQRFLLRDALSFGPWRLTSMDGKFTPGGRRFEDDELEQHWHAWARDEPRNDPHRREWGPEDWAYRVFERGEDPVAAFVECRRLQHAEWGAAEG